MVYEVFYDEISDGRNGNQDNGEENLYGMLKHSHTVINIEQTGIRIKELRRKAGFSVKDLQKAIGLISCQAIYKWQEGKTLPTIDNLIVLSELFHVPVDQIIIRDHTSSTKKI